MRKQQSKITRPILLCLALRADIYEIHSFILNTLSTNKLSWVRSNIFRTQKVPSLSEWTQISEMSTLSKRGCHSNDIADRQRRKFTTQCKHIRSSQNETLNTIHVYADFIAANDLEFDVGETFLWCRTARLSMTLYNQVNR